MKKPTCPYITPDFRCPIMQANGRKGGWKKGRKRKKREKSNKTGQK
jgi:hypothetical protein